MIAYGGADQGAPAGAEQPEEPVEPPTNTQPPAPTVAPSEPPLEVPSSTPQATPQPPLVIPPSSAPSPSAEPMVAIPIIEYRDLSYTYQALATSQSILTQQTTTLRSQQEQILTTQVQHTATLRQIQHHLGITSAPEHAITSSSEPSQAPPFVDQPMPHQEPPTGEAAEPSFPQHHSTSLRRYHFLPIFQSLLSH